MSLEEESATMLDDRKEAILAARSAVSAYANDPSERNAAEVKSACIAVMHLQTGHQKEMRVRAHFGLYED